MAEKPPADAGAPGAAGPTPVEELEAARRKLSQLLREVELARVGERDIGHLGELNERWTKWNEPVADFGASSNAEIGKLRAAKTEEATSSASLAAVEAALRSTKDEDEELQQEIQKGNWQSKVDQAKAVATTAAGNIGRLLDWAKGKGKDKGALELFKGADLTVVDGDPLPLPKLIP